jgi:hypothetical protein
MPPDDPANDEMVRQLRAVLMPPREAPLGLAVRMQARVRRAREANAKISRDARAVIGAIVFSIIAFQGSAQTVVIGAVVAVLYCALAERDLVAS